MKRRSPLLFVLALAAALRFFGLNWDGGHAPHPDERRIAFALEEISFRPLQLNPHFFAYGSFPLYVQKAWTVAASSLHLTSADFSGRIRAARVLSALIGVAMVACLIVLGRRLYGAPTGLLAGLLLGLCVLPIQHAHFITVDLHQAALVLLVLERLVAFVQSGRRGAFWAAAALTGLTFATKASSIPLLLPVVLAPLLRPRDAEGRRPLAVRLGLAAGAVALAAVFFALGEPYALLDRAAFLHDVREQAAMVRNAGSVPYTIQYLGTRPYLDDLRQALLWGTGPALGLAALLGTIAALARGMRAPRGDEILLLAFFLPYFLITGSFSVKFMRYLLPLYPIWCLWAARLLTGHGEAPAPSRRRRVAVVLIVGATAGYALAFESIYLRPHVWVTASRWFFREVPAGATVLLPHWEEGFPIGVDGQEPGRYRFVELPLYEPDGNRKTALLADRLAAGDALVFPTKRLYGSISNAPARYPQTTRFFELLFAGELGYRLERVFTSRPHLFGWEIDDDLSDESFSVYDHPKTLIFRKDEPLDAEEILARLRSRVPPTPITRRALLQADVDKPPAPEEQRPRRVTGSAAAAALWTAALAAFWLCGSRLLATGIRGLPGLAAGGLAAPLGYLLFIYLSWLASTLGFAPFDAALCTVVAALLVLLCLRHRRAPESATGLVVLLAAFIFFAAIRAWNPEIYWGEKPMDFSFLNALDRAVRLPPAEPWMSGKAINYPYFGHFGIAAVGKLLHIPPALSFNLGIAMAGALTASAAFGVGVLLSGRLRGGLLAAALVVFAGNLDGPREFVARNHLVEFNYFWATSRVIPDTINEFPLWSFLFADLHAHVMTLPLSLLFLGFAALWFGDVRPRRPVLLPLASLTLGAIATTSTWSLPVYAGALAGLGLLAALVERRPARILFPIAVAVLSYLWFAPYWIRFVPPPRNWGWENQAAPLGDVLLIFGGFLLVALLALGDRARRRGRGLLARLLFLALLAAAALAATRAGFVVFALACLLAALGEETAAARFAFALAGGAALLGAAADTVFLWDRMNTIFKLYLEMWLLLALAAAFWLATRRAGAPGGSAAGRGFRAVALVAVAVASAFTAVTDVIGTLRSEHIRGPRPTLDGTAYFDTTRPSEGLALRWLDQTIAGSPVILEAQGPSYQDFGRVSMNTGLPTVLGWEYHLQQRAHGDAEIAERRRAVATLYTSQDRPIVEHLLDQYQVAIVYVGALERRTYGAEGIGKFAAWKDVFQPIYRNPQVEIYAVPRNFRWSETAPVVEAPRTGARRPDAAPRVPQPPRILTQPRGLTVDGRGHLWVADFGNARIQEFDPSLTPLRAFGVLGEGPGEFRDPCGVAAGPDGLLYVTDTWNHRIQVLDAEGRPVREWGGEFYGPRGIAIGAGGTVYVTDTGNGRVAKFTPDGRLLARVGRKGSGTGELNEPMGIAVSAKGDIVVADAGNQRVVVFAPDGTVKGSWPVAGWKEQGFREPGVAILADGRIAVAVPATDRILFFTPAGQPAGERVLERESAPVGLAVSPGGDLFVSELKRNRIQAVSPP